MINYALNLIIRLGHSSLFVFTNLGLSYVLVSLLIFLRLNKIRRIKLESKLIDLTLIIATINMLIAYLASVLIMNQVLESGKPNTPASILLIFSGASAVLAISFICLDRHQKCQANDKFYIYTYYISGIIFGLSASFIV